MPENVNGSKPTDDNDGIVAGEIPGFNLDADTSSTQQVDNTQTEAKVENNEPAKPVEEKVEETHVEDGTTLANKEKRVSPEDGEPADLEDFLAVKQGVDPKTKEQKAADALKVKDKEVDKTKPPVDVKPDATKEQQRQDGKTARDYTGFSEEDTKLLKNMGNDAFNAFRPILIEHRKMGAVLKQKDTEIASLKVGKQSLPDAYYEHENGFVLSPEFNTTANELNQAAMVQSHWQKQLGAIRRGDDWQDATGIDKNGQLVLGAKQKATGEAEGEVMSYITSAANQLNRVQQKMLGVQNEFKGRHQKAIGEIQEAEKKYFAAYEDPKHPYAPVIKNVMESLPVEFRSSPLASLLAKSVAANVQYGKAIQMLKVDMAKGGNANAGNKATTQVSAQQQNAGPTDGSITRGSTTSTKTNANVSTVGDDISDFEKAKYS